MKKNNIKEFIHYIVFLICIIIFTILFIKYVAQRTIVSGPSMEPAYHEGDNLLLDKIFYKIKGLSRYDVIVFTDESKKILIKRIIGMPGEHIKINEEGTIYINGEKLEESYGKEIIKNTGLAAQEIILNENEYFVLGDNRNNSRDSRIFGPIKKEQIMGKVILKYAHP